MKRIVTDERMHTGAIFLNLLGNWTSYSSFIRLFLLLVGFVCFGGSMKLSAAPVVEVTIPKGESHFVGGKIVFYVKVSGEGTFSGVTQFDLPKIENVVLMQEGEHPVIDSRTEGDKEIYSQLYTFLLFCQKAGAYSIPDFPVRFSLKPAYDMPAHSYTETVKGFSLKIELPEGADPNEQVINSTDFELSETWSPKPDKEKTGNAFRRTVKMQAHDLPGMLLPQITMAAIDGIAIYPKPPIITDNSERGELVGSQQIVFDFVCERAGKYEIPAIHLRWWNSHKKTWETASVDGISFAVEGEAIASGTGTRSEVSEKGNFRPDWILGVVGIVASVIIGIFVFRRKASAEERAFKELLALSKVGDAAKAYNAYFVWLKSIGLQMNSDVMAMIGDEVWNDLQESLSGKNIVWNKKMFMKKVRTLRKRILKKVSRKETLSPLNP